jgi:ubiquitin carboxyl-terminal hydrolase 22/27/51
MVVKIRIDFVRALKHSVGHKLTSADVESRTGALYCQMCDDFIWDPTLEELRMRKYGTGTFSSKCKFRHGNFKSPSMF